MNQHPKCYSQGGIDTCHVTMCVCSVVLFTYSTAKPAPIGQNKHINLFGGGTGHIVSGLHVNIGGDSSFSMYIDRYYTALLYLLYFQNICKNP